MTAYNAARDLEATFLLDRAQRFRQMGGKIWRPDVDPCYYDESTWLVEHLGISATGESRTQALSKWIALAKETTALRATDGRPDCPYNGQPPVPNRVPVEADTRL